MNAKTGLTATAIAILFVVVFVALYPLAVAGTMNPCEALAIVFIERYDNEAGGKKQNQYAIIDAAVNNIIVSVAAKEAKKNGVLSCYLNLPKARNYPIKLLYPNSP